MVKLKKKKKEIFNLEVRMDHQVVRVVRVHLEVVVVGKEVEVVGVHKEEEVVVSEDKEVDKVEEEDLVQELKIRKWQLKPKRLLIISRSMELAQHMMIARPIVAKSHSFPKEKVEKDHGPMEAKEEKEQMVR